MCADLNVIDFDNLSLRRPEMAYDLPGGARRLLQKADGYAYKVLSGEVVMEGMNPTGTHSGRLLRGTQARQPFHVWEWRRGRCTRTEPCATVRAAGAAASAERQ